MVAFEQSNVRPRILKSVINFNQNQQNDSEGMNKTSSNMTRQIRYIGIKMVEAD